MSGVSHQSLKDRLSRPLGDSKRFLWRAATGVTTIGLLPFHSRRDIIAPYYGGAYAGEAGGPLIKIRTLSERFPESKIGYSILYILSNAIYIPQAVLAAVHRAGVPVVLNQNGVFYPSWYPDGWERENARMGAVHALATHVLYQSEFCRRTAERFLGSRNGPSEILYNAVDTTRFSPRGRPARAAKPFTLLLTGKVVPVAAYRVTFAIEAVAVARRGGLDVDLLVAGLLDPAVEAEARALVNRLGINAHVRYRGPYRWYEAPDVYRSADAYLMTKHNDPCPNVVLEALASGLPVLYLASGGVPELVGPDAGIGIEVPEDFENVRLPSPIVFAQGISRVIAARDSMSAAARASALARFDVASWLDRHEQLFSELIAKANGVRAA